MDLAEMTRDRDASMEPSSVEDGNKAGLDNPYRICKASMEPSSVEDGNPIVSRSCLPVVKRASMEPSSVEDGNKTCSSSSGHCPSRLQWSRPQLRTETCTDFDGCKASHLASMEPSSVEDGNQRIWRRNILPKRLQWSRPQLRTETVAPLPVSEVEPGFNGAVLS